ncbi:MAG: S8 family serine peptidase [Prevotella sp.]|nr:S8 family serine peptidase [Prevotella sp.]
MNKQSFSLSCLVALSLFLLMPLTALAQVSGGWSSTSADVLSNDNEDGVYKIDSRVGRNDFVPGEVLVKFRDESSVQVRRTSQGRFRSASISSVDRLLSEFGVSDMEKLFPAEQAKPKSQLRRRKAPNGASYVEEKNLDKVFLIKTSVQRADSTLQLIERLNALDEVEYAEPNYRVYITDFSGFGDGAFTGLGTNVTSPDDETTNTPDDQDPDNQDPNDQAETTTICPDPASNPLYVSQYGITQQNIQALWDKPIINTKRSVIAILDTGVDITHPDLVDNIWSNPKEAEGEAAYDDDSNGYVDDLHGWNFVDDYYDLTDRNMHGTHCAGIAAATDNGIGIVGANPQALIMPVKVLSDRGVGSIADVCKGIVYAANNGADVISMSLGHTGGISKTETDAIGKAYQTAILVAAAGNQSADIYDPKLGPHYPAAYYLVLGVQATASDGQRAGFSNYDPDGPIYSEDGVDGRNFEVSVPGVDIWSTVPGGNYKQLSGTSMATPLFAGAISALSMVKDYPSKDMLWGDLIHLEADFAKIYSDDTPRMPKLDFVSLRFDDTAEDGNGDGEVDSGETIGFYPTLRNTWADATGIKVKIAVDPLYASVVEIANDEVDFGLSLSAYGRAEIQTPISVKFSSSIGDNTRIRFTLTATTPDTDEEFTQNVYVSVKNRVKVSGLITEDRTLTADHVYLVNDNIGILEGATLTIEPGARLEFVENVGISSFGKLVAKGTPEKPIVFTGYHGASWAGIKTHESEGLIQKEDGYIYMNADSTLFTIRRTDQTPIKVNNWYFQCYSSEEHNDKWFYLSNYLNQTDADYTAYQDRLTDPNYLTPVVLRMIADAKEYSSQFSPVKTEDKPYSHYAGISMYFEWYIYSHPRDTISYCRMEDFIARNETYHPYMKDCFLLPSDREWDHPDITHLDGIRNTITNCTSGKFNFQTISNSLRYSNMVNIRGEYFVPYSQLAYLNYFNNFNIWTTDGEQFYNTIGLSSFKPKEDKSDYPSYLGTAREDIIRPYVLEIGNGDTFSWTNLSNMPDRPFAEAHGIVWKVCVNGKDAQDEFEEIAPLGVGRHKFEVWFNRPMNKEVAPQISFGVREPYTQQKVDEDGSWNEDGTVYTAYKTISGKTMSDGKNRIYVQGAEDNEFFECPYEKTRFNVLVNAAGSLATGFAAEAKMGRVVLTWNNDENDFDDAMGFNVYRHGEPYWKYTKDWQGNVTDSTLVADTLCLNNQVLDIETTEYTDYDVVPGKTYYYYYKVLSTGLTEYDVSNVVTATPLTATLGDANGSGDVDVSDVVTTVNYAAGKEPKPFIFDAADMNSDELIDILDVIGIIQKILHPDAGARVMSQATAFYSIVNGTLYVESDVALAGVQVQVSLTPAPSPSGEGSVTVAEDLNGFEQVSAWLSDNDLLFLAYNMKGKTLEPGKHALLHVGEGRVASMRLSDAYGQNVTAIGSETTGIDRMGSDVMNVEGIYDLQGRKLSNLKSQLSTLKKGVFIVNGQKVVR